MKKNNEKQTKKNKKYQNKELKIDLDYYEYQKRIDISEYQNFKHLSNKEKDNFENLFSKPKNKSQEIFLSSLKKKNLKVVIATGPAGTGKTLFSVEQGIKNFMKEDIEKLIFTRPVVTVDEDLGYLPGNIEDKLGPYVKPIFDILYNFLPPQEVENLMKDKVIEIAPLGFLRGRTFKNCWIVADEMQNSSVSQMKMLLTRIGENTKLIINGDLEQNDRHNEINGLEDFLSKLKNRRSDSISSVEFDKNDVEREKVVKEILEIYETNKIEYYCSDNNDDDNKLIIY